MEGFHSEDEVVKEYDSRLMRRLLKFTLPYMKYIVIVIFLMLTVTILNLARPYLIKTAIDNNINGFKGSYTFISYAAKESAAIGEKYLVKGDIPSGTPASIVYFKNNYYAVDGKIDHNAPYNIENNSIIQGDKSYKAYILSTDQLKVLRHDDYNGIVRSTVYLLIIAISVFLLNYLQVYLLQYTGQRIIFDIREKIFNHVESLSLSFFDKNPVGRLVTRVTNDVETLNELYTGVLVYLFKDAFLITGILIFMFILNTKLALIALFSIPFMVAAALIFKKYDRDAYRDVRVRIARINAFLSENISGMKTVQIYAKEDKKFREFDAINSDYYEATMRQVTVYAVFRPSIDLISSLALSAMLWFGGIKVIGKELEFGTLFAFVSYLQMFFEPINDITEKYDIMQSAMASSERIFMLLDTNEKIENPKNPLSFEKPKGEIEFKNVWFAYRDEEWVLRDLSFKINPGEKVAFVGATGAGKTSIISLISRLYDIQKGEILIDGINIKEIDKHDLRKNIATVLQDVFLFTGDIKSNIRLNNDNISDRDIINACRYVNADKFIEKLPDKYDSPVNERGSTFSQGERQLIAFARAIAFNPPILVLDEATSSIDTETESLIQDALEKITRNRTTIIVAHRLSTIKNADKIIVLHKGKIREIGKHEELLEKKGLYYNLYQLQYKDLEKK
ncbi:ABC transporter ATP-binding protein [Fonticella tunisiensis]|uniref:ATP-binding cassette subfamily B protein n=1 Tax=Fonticella tunisiensis TaxID=1096341 RepID=A0A4R7KQU7_9CLOT|nr:ABC transporter ATP-binding protein [Fonticella tunisiensis]TDT61096.1 ATP-binding cassette subfamily B protein [Fonticella tunisiensis]